MALRLTEWLLCLASPSCGTEERGLEPPGSGTCAINLDARSHRVLFYCPLLSVENMWLACFYVEAYILEVFFMCPILCTKIQWTSLTLAVGLIVNRALNVFLFSWLFWSSLLLLLILITFFLPSCPPLTPIHTHTWSIPLLENPYYS